MVLPEQKVPANRVNPKMFLIYSLPKVGKTKLLSELDNCLILDFEGGAEMYDCLRVPIRSCKDLNDAFAALIAKGTAMGNKFPYKYLAIDTIDKLEDYVEVAATAKYNASCKDPKDKVESITDLAYGAGHGVMRREVVAYLEKFSMLCEYLIIVSHVKEKLLLTKTGSEVTSRDISLSGKLASIVSSKMDAIGYLTRVQGVNDGNIMVNFQTFDGNIMGSRCKHLAGKQFPFDWSKIYLENEK